MSTELGKIQCSDKGCIYLTRYCGDSSHKDRRRIQITYQCNNSNWCYFNLNQKGALELAQKLIKTFVDNPE